MATLNAKDREFLSQFEQQMITCSQEEPYARNVYRKDIMELQDIYRRAMGKEYRIGNYSCASCVCPLYKALYELYKNSSPKPRAKTKKA